MWKLRQILHYLTRRNLTNVLKKLFFCEHGDRSVNYSLPLFNVLKFCFFVVITFEPCGEKTCFWVF